jgi:hypothetical protein
MMITMYIEEKKSDVNSQFLIHWPPSAGLNCLENDCTTNLVYFSSDTLISLINVEGVQKLPNH